MSERFIVDEEGSVWDTEENELYDYPGDLVPILNNMDKKIKRYELFEKDDYEIIGEFGDDEGGKNWFLMEK